MFIKLVILCSICLSQFLVLAKPRQRTPIICDVDAGIDDYQALVFLLNADARREVKIVAIVLTDGNADLKDVKENVERLLLIVGRTDIPLYVGSAKVLDGEKNPDHWFGLDGFGNLDLKKLPVSNIMEEKAPAGVDALTRMYRKRLVYIALGPLTNLALTIRLYPEFVDNVKEIIVMGGNSETAAGPEFNFLNDPAAANIVLSSVTNKPVTLLTFQACMNDKMNLEWRWAVKIRSNPVWNLADRAERNLANLNTSSLYNSCDPITVATYLEPKLITNKHNVRATVLTCGEDTGKLEFATPDDENQRNIIELEGFNAVEYQKYFIEQFTDVCKLHRCYNVED